MRAEQGPWQQTLTSLLTERLCWKSCKVRLPWEMPEFSFSHPGWKCYTLGWLYSFILFAFFWWATEIKHGRRRGSMKEQWEKTPDLPSFIQQIQSDPPKCTHKGNKNSCQPQNARTLPLRPHTYAHCWPGWALQWPFPTMTAARCITLECTYCASEGTQSPWRIVSRSGNNLAANSIQRKPLVALQLRIAFCFARIHLGRSFPALISLIP